MKKTALLLSMLLALVLVACSGESHEEEGNSTQSSGTVAPPPAPSKFTPYVIEDSSKIQTYEEGLKIYVVEEGSGEMPTQGQNVLINYHGMLTDGKVFDSSFDRGQPFNFPLGTGRVIRGWDIGIAKLSYGSKAILIIPPEIGYGAMGSPPNIPPNATLVFHVELIGSF